MNKTIVISCDDQGQYSVGEEAPESDSMGGMPGMPGGDAESGAEDQGEVTQMDPAKDLDDALAKARTLFTANPAEKAEGDKALDAGYAETANSTMAARGGM